MSLLPTIGSAALVLLLSQSATAVAAKNDAPTTSIATVWCPEDYGSFPGFYETYASVIAVDATATTYKLDCVTQGDTNTPRGGCSGWPSVTFTAGPSTAEIYAISGGELYG